MHSSGERLGCSHLPPHTALTHLDPQLQAAAACFSGTAQPALRSWAALWSFPHGEPRAAQHPGLKPGSRRQARPSAQLSVGASRSNRQRVRAAAPRGQPREPAEPSFPPTLPRRKLTHPTRRHTPPPNLPLPQHTHTPRPTKCRSAGPSPAAAACAVAVVTNAASGELPQLGPIQRCSELRPLGAVGGLACVGDDSGCFRPCRAR